METDRPAQATQNLFFDRARLQSLIDLLNRFDLSNDVNSNGDELRVALRTFGSAS